MSANSPDPQHKEQPTTRGLRPSQKVGGGRFTLVSPLGEGGMGVVWKAVDATLGGMVALKFLPIEISSDPIAIEDLRRETAQSRRLSHPNIVRVYDLYEDISPFIYMEYVEGHTLSHERVRHPRRVLPWSFLAPYVGQLCEALDYAHRERIVHRDLKPGNVLIDPQRDAVKLVDFGIARVMAESVTRITMQKPAEGTIVYMSCQQLNGEPATAMDDIYSLGVTLYELLTSKPPFHSGDTAWQIRYGEVVPVTQRLLEFNLENDVPPHIEEAVMACLARDPFKRPSTARDAAEMLGLMETRSGLSRPTTPRRSPRPSSATPSMRLPRPLDPAEDVDPEEDEPSGESGPPTPGARRPSTTRRTPRTTRVDAREEGVVEAGRGGRRGLAPLLLAAALLAAAGVGIHLMRQTPRPRAENPPGTGVDGLGKSLGPPKAAAEPHPTNGVGGIAGPEPTTPTAVESAAAPHSTTVPAPVVPLINLATNPAVEKPAPVTNLADQAVPELKPAPDIAEPAAAPRTLAPQSGERWTNSLGMRFAAVPALPRVLFSIWETRVSDYAAFKAATQPSGSRGLENGRPSPQANLPQTSVAWNDAQRFCQWLTQKELALGQLHTGQSYRLPTAVEWETALALQVQASTNKGPVYLWGSEWPPALGSANLKGNELSGGIPGYKDNFPGLAPVGSFAPNANGLFDLIGNAAEWCGNPAARQFAVRGGSFRTSERPELLLAYLKTLSPGIGAEMQDLGFRCVIQLEP